MKLELVIDGSRQTGKASSDPDHKRLYLKRAGVDLVVVSETDETLAVFEDYFVSPGAVLFGQEWTFVSASPPTGLTISELGLVSTGESVASALTVEPAIHIGEASAAMAVAVPAALVGLGALAALGGGKASTAVSPQGNPASSAFVVKGTIVLGPVLRGNGLKATVYDLAGGPLGTANANDDGSFSVNIGSYTGGIVVKVVDTNDAPDYRDEATAASKNLGNALVFMAVSQVTGATTTITVNVNAATTVAAVKAGLNAADASGIVRGGSEAEKLATIAAANSAVAQISGVTGSLVEAVAKPTISTTGAVDSGANTLGKFLASVSGMDQANGGNMVKTVQTLAAGISTTGSATSMSAPAQAAILMGAVKAEVAPKELALVIDPAAATKAQGFTSANASNLEPVVVVFLSNEQLASIADVSKIASDTFCLLLSPAAQPVASSKWEPTNTPWWLLQRPAAPAPSH